MQDYIKMYVCQVHESKMDLKSELILEEAEAKHFEGCFKHNYNCTTYIRKATSEEGYVVCALNVDIRLIHANISLETCEGLFANWKYELRNFSELVDTDDKAVPDNAEAQQNTKKKSKKGTFWMCVAVVIVFIYCIAISSADSDEQKIAYSLFFAIPFGVCVINLQAIDRKNGWIPKEENISYCPRCKSKNIKIYRESYESWSHPGVCYTNRARCRCLKCGKDWGTKYDIRFIHKK